ncbi:MAG: response regulator [Deltaproteobacteria bacterium]|nr:response regulator [Deltaproteobacteria bacterium]
MLVEDDRIRRRAVQTTLRRHGFNVVAAGDGEKALRLAKSESLRLVLLELIIPKVQGFEVLRRLKQDPKTASTPVLILSSLGQQSDIKRAMDLGAADYLVKANLSLDQLVKKVGELLKGGED